MERLYEVKIMSCDEIRCLLNTRKYQEALTECNELISQTGLSNLEPLRLRARAFSLLGRYEEELFDWEVILDSSEADLKDYFLGSQCAINCGKYKHAESHLNSLLQIGSEKNEDWFKSAGLFLLAFSQFKLNKMDAAHKNICNVLNLEPDCAMPVPEIAELLSAFELKIMIERSIGSVSIDF